MESQDIRTVFESWYVIDGNEHLRMGSFQDALELMSLRTQSDNTRTVLMMSDKEYKARYQQ